MDVQSVIALPAGSVQYALEDALVPIETLISALEEARDDGATHVVQDSGNCRGAKWCRVSAAYEFLDED